jgi:hypothetical protein
MEFIIVYKVILIMSLNHALVDPLGALILYDGEQISTTVENVGLTVESGGYEIYF